MIPQHQKRKDEASTDTYRSAYRHGAEAMRQLVAEVLRSSYDAGTANLVLLLPIPELER